MMSSTILSQVKQFCRFEHINGVSFGEVIDEKIHQLDNAPWLEYEFTGLVFDAADIKLLHPSEPQVIIGLGGAYKNVWVDKTPPKTVRWFIKPPTCAASPNDNVVIPPSLDEVKVESELTIVIGKRVKNVDETEAENAIFGYTIGNDIVGNKPSYLKVNDETEESAGPLLAPGLKICDKFAPFGPYVFTGVDWKDRAWSLTITNDETGKKIVHEDNTSNLVYSPAKIVSDLSKVLTLNPGDIILTGTSKSYVASDGDKVVVEIEGLGKLENMIVK